MVLLHLPPAPLVARARHGAGHAGVRHHLVAVGGGPLDLSLHHRRALAVLVHHRAPHAVAALARQLSAVLASLRLHLAVSGRLPLAVGHAAPQRHRVPHAAPAAVASARRGLHVLAVGRLGEGDVVQGLLGAEARVAPRGEHRVVVHVLRAVVRVVADGAGQARLRAHARLLPQLVAARVVRGAEHVVADQRRRVGVDRGGGEHVELVRGEGRQPGHRQVLLRHAALARERHLREPRDVLQLQLQVVRVVHRQQRRGHLAPHVRVAQRDGVGVGAGELRAVVAAAHREVERVVPVLLHAAQRGDAHERVVRVRVDVRRVRRRVQVERQHVLLVSVGHRRTCSIDHDLLRRDFHAPLLRKHAHHHVRMARRRSDVELHSRVRGLLALMHVIDYTSSPRRIPHSNCHNPHLPIYRSCRDAQPLPTYTSSCHILRYLSSGIRHCACSLPLRALLQILRQLRSTMSFTSQVPVMLHVTSRKPRSQECTMVSPRLALCVTGTSSLGVHTSI